MSTIAHKAKGLLIPEAFINRAMRGTTAVGFSLKDTNLLAVEWAQGVDEKFAKEIIENQAAFEDEDMMFIFLDKVLKDERQPYAVLTDDKKNFLLAGFAEGEFRNFIPTKGDEGHSNIWWMFNKHIIPKLTRLHTHLGLVQLMLDLNSDEVLVEEMSALGADEGGSLIFFDSNGSQALFTNSNKFRKYSWGYASDHLDIAEATGHEEKAAEPVVEETRVQRLKRLAAAKRASVEAPIIAAGAEPAVAPAVQTKDVTYPADTGTEYMNLDVPEESRKSHNQTKKWYQTTSKKYNGYAHLPQDWKNFPPLRCKKPVHMVKPADKPTVVQSFSEIPKEKIAQMRIASVEPIKQPTKGVVDNTALPILAPKVIEAIQEDFKTSKVLDKNSMEMPINPLKLQEDEDKYPSFWEQTLIPRDDTDRWTDDTLLNLCEKYPKAAFSLLKNYRADSIINRPTDEQLDSDTTDTSGTGTVAESKVERLKRLAREKKLARAM